MNKTLSVQRLTTAAILIAIGIIIPMFSPLKIIIEPASFTLASHVALFVAMCISPSVAAAVAVGTTLGFFFGGFPLVIVLRAASHLVFALVGAFYLQKHPDTLRSVPKSLTFSFLIGLLHAACEVVVSGLFYFGGLMAPSAYDSGFVTAVLMLVGVGTVVHSMVDFAIAQLLVNVLARQRPFRSLFQVSVQAPATQMSSAQNTEPI